jgi:hypothetical protein
MQNRTLIKLVVGVPVWLAVGYIFIAGIQILTGVFK